MGRISKAQSAFHRGQPCTAGQVTRPGSDLNIVPEVINIGLRRENIILSVAVVAEALRLIFSAFVSELLLLQSILSDRTFLVRNCKFLILLGIRFCTAAPSINSKPCFAQNPVLLDVRQISTRNQLPPRRE